MDRLTRDSQIHYLPSSRCVLFFLGFFLGLLNAWLQSGPISHLASLKHNKNQAECKLRLRVVEGDEYCLPWIALILQAMILQGLTRPAPQKRLGGEKNQQKSEKGIKKMELPFRHVYIPLCVYFYLTFSISLNEVIEGSTLKRASKANRLIRGSDWPSIWPLLLLLLLVKPSKGQGLGFIHIFQVQV